MIAEVPGASALRPVEMAKLYEELGHEVAQDSPRAALELLDKANELRTQANQEMLAEEKEMEDFAAETADRLGMNPEQKAKFLRQARGVLRSTRESI